MTWARSTPELAESGANKLKKGSMSCLQYLISSYLLSSIRNKCRMSMNDLV
jgi:hypothetical protein